MWMRMSKQESACAAHASDTDLIPEEICYVANTFVGMLLLLVDQAAQKRQMNVEQVKETRKDALGHLATQLALLQQALVEDFLHEAQSAAVTFLCLDEL